MLVILEIVHEGEFMIHAVVYFCFVRVHSWSSLCLVTDSDNTLRLNSETVSSRLRIGLTYDCRRQNEVPSCYGSEGTKWEFVIRGFSISKESAAST